MKLALLLALVPALAAAESPQGSCEVAGSFSFKAQRDKQEVVVSGKFGK